MNPKQESVKEGSSKQIVRETKPSGMPVQRRENLIDGLLWFLSPRFHPSLAIHFGELKNLSARDTQPTDQRLYIQGSKGDEMETLHMSCLKDVSKLLFMCCPASKEKKMEVGNTDEILKACEAVSEIRVEVDKLSQRVSSLQTSVQSGIKVDEKEFVISTELLMVQLLKLDSIEAEGEAKALRKNEVRRIQRYVDQLDALKERNSTGS
uniref:BAG domain-containing protein n=1 Tax=Opuntia streptacantha TaxID=393608 RepID=A0A7C9DMA5_OPUST